MSLICPHLIAESLYETARPVITLCVWLDDTGDFSMVLVPTKYKSTLVLQLMIFFTQNVMIIESFLMILVDYDRDN